MKCADIKIFLAQGAVITLAEAAAFEAHLATCPMCSSLLTELETQTEHYFDLLVRTEARPPVATLTTIRSAITGQTPKSAGFWHDRRLQVGLAALALLLLWFGLGHMNLPQANKQPILAQDVATPVTASPAIAQSQPSPTPTLFAGDTQTGTNSPFAATPTGALPSLATQTAVNVPTTLAQPLPTPSSSIPTQKPATVPPSISPVPPVMSPSPLATVIPLLTERPIVSPEVPEEYPSATPTPEFSSPTEVPSPTADSVPTPDRPTRVPPTSPGPTELPLPTAITTLVPPTIPPPIATQTIGVGMTSTPTENPLPPLTAIGTPVATQTPTSVPVPATLSPTPTPTSLPLPTPTP